MILSSVCYAEAQPEYRSCAVSTFAIVRVARSSTKASQDESTEYARAPSQYMTERPPWVMTVVCALVNACPDSILERSNITAVFDHIWMNWSIPRSLSVSGRVAGGVPRLGMSTFRDVAGTRGAVERKPCMAAARLSRALFISRNLHIDGTNSTAVGSHPVSTSCRNDERE